VELPTLVVEEVEYSSASGVKLAIENGIQYPPAVLLNGRVIAKGRIDADEMIAEIHAAVNGVSV
jgi:alkyl hydroperoxide reductase subunit AhpF